MNELIPQGTQLPKKPRAKPTIITLDDGRKISSDGRLSIPLIAEWLRGEPDEWVTVAEIAKFAVHNANPRSKRSVRRRMRPLVTHFRSFGIVLLVEYGADHNGASAVKIYRGTTEQEKQAANEKLQKMRLHKDATENEICQMAEIIAATHLVAENRG